MLVSRDDLRNSQGGATIGTKMSSLVQDTIAAIATPAGQGAIGVLRVTGPKAFSILERVFKGPRPQARVATFGRIVDQEGGSVDEVLLTIFPKPHSYTGEDVVEISCHGGLLVTRTILELLLESGARSAEGGEFTQRAFLNGKMDLTQAEAVMDVISAQTNLALRAANEQLRGRLGNQVEELRQNLVGVIAHVEAFIDFPEEDIDPETGDALTEKISGVADSLQKLAATAEQGHILREGVRTVICGAPNVGKSSLLNVLLGFDRAIVSETPGTTRDTIEEVLNVEGIPLRLIDTAGIRSSGDEIEREGITRAEQQIQNAELVLEVFDASIARSENAAPVPVPASTHHVPILNKCDLEEHSSWGDFDAVRLSCKDRRGTDDLSGRIVSNLMGNGQAWGDQSVAVNARHRACLTQAERYLRQAAEALANDVSPEFVAVDLRSALDEIGQVVGKTDIEEILGEIFASFCIGK